MNKNIFRLAAASAAVVMLTSCSNPEKLLESTKDEQTVVMTAGGFDVPMEIYRYVALNYKSQYEKGQSSDIWLGEDGQALIDKMNENIRETIVNMYTTPSLAAEYGIDIDSDFVRETLDTSMELIYEGYENDYKVYTEYLRDYNMTDGVYRFFVRNDILAEELVLKMLEKGEIPSSDEELRAVIAGDEFIRVKQILIPSDNGKTAEENYKTACEVYAKVLAGEDFDELIKNCGGDLFMFNNPDGYYMCRGSYHESFEEAAFALEVGEFSEIVETDAGYSIIKRYEKESSYTDKHFAELADTYVESRYNIALEKHSASIEVIDTDKLADYPIFNLSMNSED